MTVKRLLLALILASLLLAIPAALGAQDSPQTPPVAEQTASTPAPPEGLTTLIFLLGTGAIIAVGGVTLLRENFKADNNT